jgi:hypothetical protein
MIAAGRKTLERRGVWCKETVLKRRGSVVVSTGEQFRGMEPRGMGERGRHPYLIISGW